MPLNVNPEIPQSRVPEESEQPTPVQTADLEEAASASTPKIPRLDSTPVMKVQS